MRRLFVVLLSVLCLVATSPVMAAPAPGEQSPGVRPPGGPEQGRQSTPDPRAERGRPGRAHADVDRDGLSDDLEQDLAGKGDNDAVDVVVTFDGPGNAARARRAVGGFEVRREFRLIDGFAATMTVGQARALARRSEVFRVEPDFEVTVLNDAANADFGTAAARGKFQVTGAGIDVCVVDTGVDPNHEQLDSKPVRFFDAVNGRTEAYDDHGHGTHVAATAVGDGTGSEAGEAYGGVAPAAGLWAAKVLSSSGSGTDSQVVAGIEWCVDEGQDKLTPVDIISMSLGSGTSSDGQDAISQAANAAAAAGKVVVVAAGNSGDAPTSVGSPAAAADVIAVGAAAEWSSARSGAANASRGVHLAPWSSRGPTADDRVKPDVTAPGMSITSAQANTKAGYVTWDGTSMATPFVAGTAALTLEAGAAAGQVKTVITETARDVGPPGKDNDWGSGLLDGYAAVARAAGAGGLGTFPTREFVSAKVANHGLWTHTFEVTDTSVPIAATVLIDGKITCLLPVGGACWWYGWDAPDLDVRLRGPSGAIVDESTCPLGCHPGSIGRQETIDALPPSTGTYVLEVYPYEGEPNNGAGGSFTVDLFYGPAGAEPGDDPNTSPTADPVTVTTSEDTPVSVTLSGSDAESCDLVFSIASAPDSGTLGSISDAACSGTGPHRDSATVTYTPDADSHGTDSLTYTVADTDGAQSAPATVDINVTSVNDGSPTADFSVSCADLSCSFTDASSDPSDGAFGSIVSWSWAFGDGAGSTARHPDHTYGSAGTYDVTLTVTDNDGASTATREAVTVSAPEETGIVLTVTGQKIKGIKTAYLTWTGTHTDPVRVYRDGAVIATDVRVDTFTDQIGRGGGTHTYWVCDTASPPCSNEVSVSF